ncbi:MAG: DASS family sodium-coupled anion symporter [Nitrospirota bacterium]|nr:DASS family sodium-coupled anion symporter [Nitrospirota bacterium]
MRVVVDTRPLWVILLSVAYRPAAFIGLGAIFWYIIHLTPPAGLTEAGLKTIGVFVVCLFLWVTGLIPLSITSLLAMVMIPLLGIMESKKVYSLFGNEAVFFILGAFILAAAMMKSGLSSRMALLVLRRCGGTPTKLLLGVYLFPAFLSFWMSEHAVAAMMFPIVLEIAKALGLKPMQSGYAKSLFLASAWGCIIGGVATFLGGARNPLAIGILKESTGSDIDFFEWMVAVVPVVLILLAIGFVVILKWFPRDIVDTGKAAEVLDKKNEHLGAFSLNEKMIGGIMVLAIVFWILEGKRLGLANIAIIAVTLLFVFRLIRWKDVEEYVNWGILLMYGGAIALGAALASTGAAEWAANATIGRWATSPMALVLLFSALSILLTEAMSNAAIIAILMPVGISLSAKMGMDPKIITMAIAMPSGLAYCLPISTPATAIAYSSGFFRMKDLVVPGVIMGVVSWVVFNLMIRIYWPLIGHAV